MLTSTFQLAPGVGPQRERQLWQAGVIQWDEYARATEQVAKREAPSRGLPRSTEALLRRAVQDARAALAGRNAERLSALLPEREHWRLFAEFGEGAAYLDIETSDDTAGAAGISAIGVLDRRGLSLLLAGRDLEHFPELTRGWSMLVTFNGSSFDVPILRRAFPGWEPPQIHVDLRHVLARLGHGGGLKAIEQLLARLHLARPSHLAGLHGGNAAYLLQRGRSGDREALRRFAEYNLYDVVSLRTLMAYAYNEMSATLVSRVPALEACARAVPVPERGDVLYDVSKILLTL